MTPGGNGPAMASLDDPGVRALLDTPNHAVVTTLGADGQPHSTVVWVDLQDGRLALNSAVGRAWPTNLERDPRITVVVLDESNPYTYVEVRGRATATTEGADEHIERLSRKYTGGAYAGRAPGMQRVTYLVEADRVRYRDRD